MADSTPKPLSVTDFLNEQDIVNLVATVEKVPGESGMVKVTPWVPNAGCLCHFAFKVPEASIKSVRPTGQTHYCCGKILKVVEVLFKDDATMKISEVFGQMMQAASGGHEEAHAHQPSGNVGPSTSMSHMMPMAGPMLAPPAAGPMTIICPFGYSACQGRCGESCYSPASGQTCSDGQVCPFGYRQCGCACYNPAAGQTCHLGMMNTPMMRTHASALRSQVADCQPPQGQNYCQNGTYYSWDYARCYYYAAGSC